METVNLNATLKIRRCPHCSIDNPNLTKALPGPITTSNDVGGNTRLWLIYSCARCGGMVLACREHRGPNVTEMYPSSIQVNDVLPSRVKTYLQQAIDSTFAPSGSVILCASAVDSMLKEKGYKTGSLYKRIQEAVSDSLITPDMAIWAHEVRIGANDERHADEDADLPSVEDAKQAIEFTSTLAELLFVLPAKVTKGIEAIKPDRGDIVK